MFGVIASGGMAAVHYGLMNGPVGFRRTVAIKRLHEQFAEDPEFVSQFLDEARLAARIRHPNVVQTLDVVAQKRQLLLVMEYVDGETLGRLLVGTLKRRAAIPVEQAVGIVTGALHGLHAAHEATDEHGLPLRIVHRDVSPQNILIGRDGVARVLDFGVATAAARIHSTQGAKIKGKLRYMSPEQVGGSGVDRRTDIFAAGVVLWESLAGRRLFDSKEGAGAIINQVLSKPIPPPSRFRADVPRALDEVVLKALQRERDHRFQTALELAIALEEAVRIPSAHATGKWMKSIAGDDLDERARVIGRIEKHNSDELDSRPSYSEMDPFDTPSHRDEATRRETSSGRAGAHASSSAPPTETMTVQERAKHESRRTIGILAGALVALALLGLSLVIVGGGTEGTPDVPSLGSHVDRGAAPAREPSETTAAPTVVQPTSKTEEDRRSPVVVDLEDSAASDGEAIELDEVPEVSPVKASTSTTKRPAPRQTIQRSQCANPIYVDEKGIKRFKVECL